MLQTSGRWPVHVSIHTAVSFCRGDVLYPMQDVNKSLARATGVNLKETIAVAKLKCTAYYAGHVMGAAMFHCQTGSVSVLYTGDYNMVSDRHLGAAKVPRLMPDVMITESTYATTLRDPRRTRERKLLEAVHAVVKNGGKVLIPVFAVGSAQEMSLLIDSFWQRMHLNVCLPCVNCSQPESRQRDANALFHERSENTMLTETRTALSSWPC